ncbi:MAG: SpaA isopeptide-forming pilin-related protein [Bacilli bacterium]
MLAGYTEVSAATLTQTPVDNWYYTRRGGGKPYMSAQWNLYDLDGKTAYCIEPGVNITTSDYEGAIGWINSPYSDEVNRKIQLYGYYGYNYPGHGNLRYRAAAQSLIWEATGGQIIEFWTERYGNGNFINLNAERNEILRLASTHYEVPTFDSDPKDAVIGETTTFTDTKGILSNFDVVKSSDASVSINENTLSVTPNVVGNITVVLKKKTYTQDPTIIFVGKDATSQKMGMFGVDDPVLVRVKLNVVGGSLKINKKDLDTKLSKPQGDATFKNAVYELLDENYNFITDLIIDDSFGAKTDKILSPNKIYILREKTASEGYLLDKTEYRFKIDRDNLDIEMDVYEDVIEKTVNIYKVFADGSTTILKGEPNVSFEIYLKSIGEYYKTIKTDEKGFVSVKLPYGKWIFKQVSSTSGFEKVKDFEIVINNDSDEDITKIISNAEIKAKLKLIKVDSESRKILVRDGIKFRIKNLDTGEYVCQNVTYPGQEKICVFETKDGMFITPYVLGYGNYQIEELEEQSIPGYVWNSVPLKFSIDENSKFIQDDEFGLMLEVQFENKEVKGEVEIKKVGEKLVIENGTFRYEEIELDGVHYDLIADGDIYAGDGTLIYKDKQLIKSFVTKDGYFKLTNLYLGKYCLIETKTVGNHVLNSKPYCFEIKYKDQYTDTIKLVINQKNYLAKGDFELSKVDLSTGEPVEGALIEIYTEDDILIYSGRTDKLGKLYVKGLESGKKYKFVEKEAPEGYILNDEIHEFEILNNGDIVKDTLSNEKIVIDVPNTFANDYKILIPVSLCGLGIILVLLSKDKRKKK